ncbi:helix-turn-helix transcriptional regulator [Parvularcula lutaonensis]|uniref:Autoinducer binding domain-containing protein n=1 Tax=Parvularcula lutaonensis TaxID=491923 RepID=A0ABV7MEV0_9PROT|nr:LuxR family transcriptional regulator [Parvularcula lutaonensis]
MLEFTIDAIKRRGITRMSYHHMPPPGAFDHSPYVSVITEGFPEEWVERYKDKQYYLTDPIPRRALSAGRPFWWSDAGRHFDLSEKEKAYLDELERADLGDGLAVPVFGPHGRDGYVGLGCGQDQRTLSTGQIIELQYICQAAHLRYCELLAKHLPKAAALSEREQEILNWIARGKSNAVIAEILGLSANTVDTYVRRIFKKFDVGDRVSAVLRGYALGLLS